MDVPCGSTGVQGLELILALFTRKLGLRSDGELAELSSSISETSGS
jgi:hypothetical protein